MCVRGGQLGGGELSLTSSFNLSVSAYIRTYTGYIKHYYQKERGELLVNIYLTMHIDITNFACQNNGK